MTAQASEVECAQLHHMRLLHLDNLRCRASKELVDEDDYSSCAFEMTAQASGVECARLHHRRSACQVGLHCGAAMELVNRDKLSYYAWRELRQARSKARKCIA